MRTTRVPPAEWRRMLDELSRTYEGAIISLEILGADTGAQPEFIDQPLRGITADRSGITIRIAQLEHTVAHPRDLRIAETDEGAVMALEIDEETGTNTLMQFRSPVRPELLDKAVE